MYHSSYGIQVCEKALFVNHGITLILYSLQGTHLNVKLILWQYMYIRTIYIYMCILAFNSGRKGAFALPSFKQPSSIPPTPQNQLHPQSKKLLILYNVVAMVHIHKFRESLWPNEVCTTTDTFRAAIWLSQDCKTKKTWPLSPHLYLVRGGWGLGTRVM